jgi:putative zinc finger/helix-turn-helix YgiT family protein
MTHDVRNERPGGRDKPFPWRCVKCLKRDVYPATVSYTAEVNHDGRLYEVPVPVLEVPRCQSCGELVFTNHVDEQITDALRTQLRLLAPAQIRTSRKALGLLQQELAERLGVAEATISRWETGTLIQSRAMDNLLRAYFALPELRAALRGVEQDPAFGAAVLSQQSG